MKRSSGGNIIGADHGLRQQTISLIEKKLQTLSDRELHHIGHVLAALEASKDGSMHYFGSFSE